MKVDVLPIEKIRPHQTLLRTIDKELINYQTMRDSVRRHGFFNAISVQTANQDGIYVLIDGFVRYSIALDLGLKVMPAQIKDLSDKEIEVAQLVANTQGIPTKPVQITRHLQRILDKNVGMTKADLATLVCHSPSWIDRMLGLLKLTEKVQGLVDDGQITVSNGSHLAKLPQEEQEEFLKDAVSEPSERFAVVVGSRLKEIQNAKQHRAKAPEFEPKAFVRRITEIKREIEKPRTGKSLIEELDPGNLTPVDAWVLALKWALNLDPHSVQKQEANWTERRATTEQAKKSRANAREEQKRTEALGAASEAGVEFE